MSISIDKKKAGKFLRRAFIVCGIGGVVLGASAVVKSCSNNQQAAEAAKHTEERNTEAYNQYITDLTSRSDSGTDYNLLGNNTASVVEADVVYRFNFAAKLIVVRHNVDPREGVASIVPFADLDASYIERAREVACEIAREAPAQRTNRSKEDQATLDTLESPGAAELAYAAVFAATHCNIPSKAPQPAGAQ